MGEHSQHQECHLGNTGECKLPPSNLKLFMSSNSFAWDSKLFALNQSTVKCIVYKENLVQKYSQLCKLVMLVINTLLVV